jgi:ribosomal protein S16
MHSWLVFLLIVVFSSCTNETSEKTLSKEDHAFIESLGILEPKEEIELFESNGGWDGIKSAGAFITSQRIAYYWIEDGEKEINTAYFATDIDSIALTDLSTKLTYASYITVYQRSGSSFKVYIDADSTRVKAFYDLAQERLKNSGFKNKPLYNLNVGDTLNLFFNENTFSNYCLPNQNQLKHLRYFDKKVVVPPSKKECEGCSITVSKMFIATSTGIDTILYKSLKPMQNCSDNVPTKIQCVVRVK